MGNARRIWGSASAWLIGVLKQFSRAIWSFGKILMVLAKAGFRIRQSSSKDAFSLSKSVRGFEKCCHVVRCHGKTRILLSKGCLENGYRSLEHRFRFPKSVSGHRYFDRIASISIAIIFMKNSRGASCNNSTGAINGAPAKLSPITEASCPMKTRLH